jgi:hypothetical protein
MEKKLATTWQRRVGIMELEELHIMSGSNATKKKEKKA